jgi:hypothetical protein
LNVRSWSPASTDIYLINDPNSRPRLWAQKRQAMSLQVLTLTLDGITAGDYLTWCRDPDPPALGFGLRSISIDADPLGDTITAILDWEQPAPTPATAATAAGLTLSANVWIGPRKQGLFVGAGRARDGDRTQRQHNRRRRTDAGTISMSFLPLDPARRTRRDSDPAGAMIRTGARP